MFYLLTWLPFDVFQSRWACSMGLPVWPPLSAATPALSWFCASGPQARQCPHDWLWASQTGWLWVAFWTQAEEFRTCRGESERGYPGGRSQVHGPWAAPRGVWTSCRCFQVQKPINEFNDLKYVTDWFDLKWCISLSTCDCDWTLSFSLGVTILELACNIEVPNGGEGWQQLRQGCPPSEFTSGKNYCFFKCS